MLSVLYVLITACGGGSSGDMRLADMPPIMSPDVSPLPDPSPEDSQALVSPEPEEDAPLPSRPPSVSRSQPLYSQRYLDFNSYGPWLEGIFETKYGVDVINALGEARFRTHAALLKEDGSVDFLYNRDLTRNELDGARYKGDVAGIYRATRQRLQGTVNLGFSAAGSQHVRFDATFTGVPVPDFGNSFNPSATPGTFSGIGGCALGVGCTSRIAGYFFNNGTLGGVVESADFTGLFATKKQE